MQLKCFDIQQVALFIHNYEQVTLLPTKKKKCKPQPDDIYIIKELVLKQCSKFYASGGNIAKLIR